MKHLQLYTNHKKFLTGSGRDVFTIIYVIANTLQKRLSSHTPLIYTKMLNRCHTLSILDTALDFTGCASNKNI